MSYTSSIGINRTKAAISMKRASAEILDNRPRGAIGKAGVVEVMVIYGWSGGRYSYIRADGTTGYYGYKKAVRF